jgi:hypothetical protein
MNHIRVAITDYCERVDDTFWAEPVNAITNLVFLFVAMAIGSFLWRTYAPSRQGCAPKEVPLGCRVGTPEKENCQAPGC